MSEFNIEEVIKEIMTLVEPVRDKATIVFIIAEKPMNGHSGDYGLFGNLPDGRNKELVKAVALDLCAQELSKKIDEFISLTGNAGPNKTVN